MTFILISGAPNTGKTHICKELYDLLYNDQTYTKLGGWNINHNPCVNFVMFYEKNGKYVVLNSASDNNNYMDRLAQELDSFRAKYGRLPDIIITSIRETGEPISRMLALLEAAEKGTSNLQQHYARNIANATPTTLIRNVSLLLHLTKQPVSANQATHAAALAPYWSKLANDAKQELDRIIASLTSSAQGTSSAAPGIAMTNHNAKA